MTFASGAFKDLVINEEVTFGTLVASGGQSLRRVQSTVDMSKDVYRSNEIRTDRQIAVSRHGMRKVGGAISGELSPGTYQRLMQAMVGKDFVTGGTTSAQTTISAAAGKFSRSAGSFLTNGFKIGDIVQPSGFVATANNSRRYLVTNVTAADLSVCNVDGTSATITVEASGASVTIAVVGKITYIPTSSHTDKSFSIEHYFSDIAQSEAFVGCKVGSMNINLPTTGLVTCDFDIVGRDMQTATSRQLTSPTSISTSGGFASVNGAVLVNGVAVGILNSLQFKIENGAAGDGVVGSNLTPNVWVGPIIGSGQISAFFQDATFRDYFVDETEIGIVAAFATTTGAAPEVVSFALPRVKINGATKDDKQTGGIKLTGNIEFLRNTAGGSGTSTEDTTLRIVDTLAT